MARYINLGKIYKSDSSINKYDARYINNGLNLYIWKRYINMTFYIIFDTFGTPYMHATFGDSRSQRYNYSQVQFKSHLIKIQIFLVKVMFVHFYFLRDSCAWVSPSSDHELSEESYNLESLH